MCVHHSRAKRNEDQQANFQATSGYSCLPFTLLTQFVCNKKNGGFVLHFFMKRGLESFLRCNAFKIQLKVFF